METTLFNVEGKEIGKTELPGIFETKISKPLLHEVVTGFMANQRSGTHSTKTRGEVSGGGRKPWKEKGTGNARAGSNRSPLWRKGGIIFGPRPHGYRHDISQSKRSLSLWMALSEKIKDGNLVVVDDIPLDKPKTRQVVEILKKLNSGDRNVLVVTEKIDKNFKIASHNIPFVEIEQAASLNTYQVLWAHKLIITPKAIEKLNSRTGSEGKK